jgi:Phage ABA sandwich domain
MNSEDLPPGRELDLLVAEQMLGLERVSPGGTTVRPTPEMLVAARQARPDAALPDRVACPEFSTSIRAAWLLVEEMRRRGLEITILTRPGAAYTVRLALPDGSREWVAAAESPALAICRAALAAGTPGTE